MSSAIERLLVAFEGEVECRCLEGAINLTLLGCEPGAQAAPKRTVEVLLAGAQLPGTLPARLHDVRLTSMASGSEPEAQHLLLRSRELQLPLSCRSLQVHRPVAAEFFAAVPPVRVPLRTRIGWRLLLSLLRLPGSEALLTRVRGHR